MAEKSFIRKNVWKVKIITDNIIKAESFMMGKMAFEMGLEMVFSSKNVLFKMFEKVVEIHVGVSCSRLESFSASLVINLPFFGI